MLSEALKTNTSLTNLNLTRKEQLFSKRKKERDDKIKYEIANNIGDSGTRMFSEALKTNTTLTKLNLYGNKKRTTRIINNQFTCKDKI